MCLLHIFFVSDPSTTHVVLICLTFETVVLKWTIKSFLTTSSRIVLLFFPLFWVQTSLRAKNRSFQIRFPSHLLPLNARSSFFVLV